MKKSLITFFALCCVSYAVAADLPNQGFGFHIGYAQPVLRLNAPTNPSTAKDSLSNTTRLNGLKVGLVYDGSFIKGFGSSIGFNYTFAASTSPWTAKNPATLYPQIHNRIFYHELEVFVDWQYKFQLAKETYIILFTGPTIQCGLLFNTHQDERAIDGTVTADTKSAQLYTTDDPDLLLKRLNVTWGVGAGFQFQRYFVRGGYDFGLITPYKNSDFTNGYHTHGRLDQWSIKIGMYLWYPED